MSDVRVARVGDVLELGFEGSPTTGYRWTMVNDSSGVIELVGDEWEHRDVLVGGNARQVFRLRAQSPGDARLTFRYQRPWEAQALKEETVTITIAALEDN